MEYLVKTENLEKRYDDFTLAGVNLTLAPGTVVGFIGSNGAGKTTTLKAILGMIDADGGTVELLGHPVTANSRIIDAVKGRIGVVLDTCAFPASCRVADVGSIGRAAYADWDRARFEELCHRFNLEPKKKVLDLSRGMGMKLTLAFALAHNPQLLILDEATAGLDPLAREEVLDLLRQFMEQPDRGILMSTHITSDLEKIADRVVCIDEGSLIFDLPKDAITDEAGVAHLRADQVEVALGSDAVPTGTARVLRTSYSTDVLVPDRFAFARVFPDIPIDAATIEDYMTLMLKGESR